MASHAATCAAKGAPGVDASATESLVIDIENKRYDLQATYRHQLWHFNINLSLIDNDAGFMDQTIERWHDFFGLPQGGRDTAANDRIDLFYQQDGVTVIDSQQGDSGLADIQFALGFQLSDRSQVWLGIELPSGDSNPLFSNDGIDLALWYAARSNDDAALQGYGLVGIALPADDGLFEGRLESQVLFGQLGLLYRWRPAWQFFVQADVHSGLVKDTNVDGLDHSLQAQFGLRLPRLMQHYQLDLFFSEDIAPGHAPDITFSLRFSPRR